MLGTFSLQWINWNETPTRRLDSDLGNRAGARSPKRVNRDVLSRGSMIMSEEHEPTCNSDLRLDNEPPAVTKQGWRYHHIGIPTDITRPGEKYLADYGLYVSGFETSPYGIEWMRFEKDSPISELVKTVPHIAFEVDDLDKEVEGKELLGEISSPSEGTRVAMFIDNGAPVELIEFRKEQAEHTDSETRP